jgi:DNA-binding beta-propeller fold protein YncE
MKGLAVAFLLVFGPGLARGRGFTAGPDGAGARPKAMNLPRRAMNRGSLSAIPRGLVPSSPGDFSIINVAVGLLPWDAVISPDERWAYVLSAGSNEIDVVSLARPSLSRRVFLEAFPTAMALSPDGSELYLGVASPPLTDYPSDGSCQFVLAFDPSSSILIMDTASMTVTGIVPVGYPGLVNALILGPGGAQLAAVTDSALLVIDTRTRSAVSIPVIVTDGNALESAVFASNGTKVFASFVAAKELIIFDLTNNTAHAAPPAPDGYTYINPVIADPGADKIFVDVSGADSYGMVVLDAKSEKILKVIVNVRVFGGALVRPDGRVGFFPFTSGVVDLVGLERIGELPVSGVSGALSPGGSLLYLRVFGGFAGAVTYYANPGHYDLAVIDTASLKITGYMELDSRDVTCSWPSPVRVSASGRYLVAPNPTLNSVSIIKVDTEQERYPVDVSHPRPAPILIPNH